MSGTTLGLLLIGVLVVVIAAVTLVIVLGFKSTSKKRPTEIAKENEKLKKEHKGGELKLTEVEVTNTMDRSLKSVREYCAPDGLNPNPLEYLELNDGGRPVYVCSMFARSLPHMSTFAQTYSILMNMPDCTTNVFIEPLTQAKSEKMADKQVIALSSEARAANRNYDINRSRKISSQVAKVEEWAHVIEAGLNTLYRVAFMFTLRANTVEELYDACARLYSNGSERNIELSAAYATHPEAYMSAAPLNTILKVGFGPLRDQIVDYHILDKNALGDIFNHTEAFFSHKNGVLWGRNLTTHQPVIVDVYDKSHSNYNFIINGITGSGKSAGIKMLISRYIEVFGYRFAVIDFDSPNGSEGEYVPLVKTEGGVVFQLKHNSENVLNIFDIDVENEYVPSMSREVVKLNVMEKVNDCTNIVLMMIRDGKTNNDFENDVYLSKLIQESILELYDDLGIKEGYPDTLYEEKSIMEGGKLISGSIKKEMPTVSKLFIKLLNKRRFNSGNYPDNVIALAIAGMAPYVKEIYYSEKSIGLYDAATYDSMQVDENGFKVVEIDGELERVQAVRGARPYFDGQSTLSVNKQTQCMDIDISQLPDEDKAIAQQVGCNYVNEYFIKKNSNNPHRLQKCIVLIDEFHRTFHYEEARKFIESLYRQARKRYVSMCTITQALADYNQYDETRAIVKNTAMKIMFKQSRMDEDFVRSVTPLTEAQIDRVMRLGGTADVNGVIERSRKGECVLIDNDDTVVFLKTDYLMSETVICETDPEKIAKMYGSMGA